MELGACTQLWNYLYIDDAVNAIVTLLTGDAPQVSITWLVKIQGRYANILRRCEHSAADKAPASMASGRQTQKV